jgi:hypothetical protein
MSMYHHERSLTVALDFVLSVGFAMSRRWLDRFVPVGRNFLTGVLRFDTVDDGLRCLIYNGPNRLIEIGATVIYSNLFSRNRCGHPQMAFSDRLRALEDSYYRVYWTSIPTPRRPLPASCSRHEISVEALDSSSCPGQPSK